MERWNLEGSQQAAQAAAQLLTFFRRHQLAVFHVQHIAIKPGATFFLPDSSGAAIHASLQPLADEPVIEKHFPNSFRETELLARLQHAHIQQLTIAGMMTHMCVDATIRAATDLGYACLTAHDACATRALQFGERTVAAADVQAAFLAAIHGSYGRVMTAQDIIAERLKDNYRLSHTQHS